MFIDYLIVLKRLGHEVVAIIKYDAPYADHISQLGISVKKIKNSFGYYDFFAIKEIQNLLLEFDADVVMSHIGRSISLSRRAAGKIKSKKIFTIAVNHSMNVKRSIGADFIFSVNKKIFYRTVDLGQDKSGTFAIPNAVDLPETISSVRQINLRQQDVVTIGVMGRIDETKGFQYAIKAIKNLEKISPKKFILKLAGTGIYQEVLRKLVKELKLENKIEFIGWVSDKKSFFESIDIFCSTSSEETFGLVLLEAMKYHKPIIATDTDGTKEVLRDGIDGIVIKVAPRVDTDKRLTQAILEMVKNTDLTNKIVENANFRLYTKFSYHSLEKLMREVFGKVDLKKLLIV